LQSMLSAPAQGTVVHCRIAALASLRGSAEKIALWRRQPICVGGVKMPATFLKHAEDQTVLALTAVLEAMASERMQNQSFSAWGVLAAPNLFGRVSIAQTIEKFQAEGAWGVSPHLIPHQSLHAMSGTISQALTIHGPNFGIGGGPNGLADAFLLSSALLADDSLPGLWLVLSGYETEWIPAIKQTTQAPTCLGVALALVPGAAHSSALSLSIGPASAEECPEIQLGSFVEQLARGAGQWRLAGTHLLELSSEGRP